jgi:hypothetical protein
VGRDEVEARQVSQVHNRSVDETMCLNGSVYAPPVEQPIFRPVASYWTTAGAPSTGAPTLARSLRSTS